MPRLTDKLVANVKPDPDRRVEIWDDIVSGFGLRVTQTGAKSFVLMYRVGGRSAPKRRLTLGSYPRLGVGEARQAARDALDQVSRGIDPAAPPATASSEGQLTFKRLVELYLENTEKRSIKEEERQINKDLLPAWGDCPAAQISREDVVGVLQAVAERGPIAANRLKSLTSSIFKFGLSYNDPETRRPLLSASPVVNIAPFGDENSRTRVLSDREIRAIWEALPAVNATYQRFVRMLFLTAQRRDEVAQLQLDQVETVEWAEWGYAGPVWTVPGHVAKNGVPNVVPLIESAWEQIRGRNEPYAFPARGHDDRPISGFSKAKLSINDVAKVEDWRFHDIRRTVATRLAELGVLPHVTERLLNHTTGQLGGVAGIYNRFQYVREKHDALSRWADYLATKVKVGF